MVYIKRCLLCGSENIGIVQPIKGSKYYITEADITSTGNLAVYREQGMLIDLYRCNDCGFFLMRNDDNFKKDNPT